MNKKVILLLIILLAIGIFYGYNYYTHVRDSKFPDYYIENRNKEFKTDEERKKYIKSLEGTPEEIEKHSFDDAEKSGGYLGIEIYGLDKLTDKMEIDTYINIEEKITLAINLLDQVYKDTNNFGENELLKYFNKKKNILFDNYGINEYEEFKRFLSNINYLDKRIIKAELSSEIEDVGNIYKFNLAFELENEMIKNQKIQLIHMVNEKKYLVVWE